MKGAQALEARSADFAAAMAAETGASAIWAGFNVHLAADAGGCFPDDPDRR
jgi:benzaldehyde dehydrogenase (NAD)